MMAPGRNHFWRQGRCREMTKTMQSAGIVVSDSPAGLGEALLIAIAG
jgi:hypothetical protein